MNKGQQVACMESIELLESPYKAFKIHTYIILTACVERIILPHIPEKVQGVDLFIPLD
jgi:hypothetical protein